MTQWRRNLTCRREGMTDGVISVSRLKRMVPEEAHIGLEDHRVVRCG